MFPRSCLIALLTLTAWAQDPPYLREEGWKPLLNGKDLTGWHAMDPAKPHEWKAVRGLDWDRVGNPKMLRGIGSGGDRMYNGAAGRTQNFVTDEKHGDVELYIEFMVAKGSNSGVYLQGLYEVQILDSNGATTPLNTGDCGAIYHRWIDNKPVGGSVPKVNACLPAGQWQSYHIWFRAPRFDASGKKTENARFLRVIQNGQWIQEDVEVFGGTRAHMDIAEAALNPLMLQGDHGPVAFRNIYWRPFRGVPEWH
jgi:hypothetical protein